MLIHSTSQLITLASGPQRGSRLGDLGVLPNGAVLVRDGRVVAVGPSEDFLARYPDEIRLNAEGCAVLPGFVDPHTHLVWAGDRAAEFEMRLQGKTYLEIMAAGGGIQSTVQATRAATEEQLMQETRARATRMFNHGTTTAEAKSGYGLEINAEIRQLETLLKLDQEGPLEIAPTFLGAHAVPAEYQDRGDEYTRIVCEEMLPAVRRWWSTNAGSKPLPFVDVFCEKGAFSLEQSRQILSAARQMGFPLKAHVDEFENLGGADLARALGAVSIDHAVKTSPEEIRALGASDTAVVSLPCTPFGLVEAHYSPARELLAADGFLAIATDLNPGTAWCESMQFVIALACRYLKLTPAQALAAATINAAYAIRRHTEVGSIEIGKQADLLILDVADYRHLAYRFGGNLVKTVIKKGEIFPIH